MTVIDLNSIKTEIKSILDAENTTTASVIDLSNGLSERVKEVLTVNPEVIPIGAERLPAISIWIDSKSLDIETIAATQAQAKRKTKIGFKIAGIVYTSFVDDFRTDNADDEAAILMENIEEVLRNNDNLNNKVLWHYPLGTTYHNFNLAEETNMRVGLMDYETTLFY